MKIRIVALNSQYIHASLSLRQIRSALPGCGGDVDFFESHINLPEGELLRDVARGGPQIVCFSCYIWNITLVLRLSRALRGALPGVKILLGGPEVEHDPGAFLKLPEVDYVLRGEAESAWPAAYAALTGQTLRAAPGLCHKDSQGGMTPAQGMPDACDAPTDEAVSGVPGLCHRDSQGGMVLVPAAPPAADWPFAYEAEERLDKRLWYVETSRGCPFKCAFCLSPAGSGVRMLDAGEASRRLIAMADKGASTVKLVDRTFNADPRRADAIMQSLIAEAKANGVRAMYHFEICAQLLDEPALQVIAGAPEGLFQFEIGVQSTDDMVLSGIQRRAAWRLLEPKIRALIGLRNVQVHLDLICALPGDDIHTIARSLDEVISLGPSRLHFGFLKLLRGSALRIRAQEWPEFAYAPDAPYEVLRTGTLTYEDISSLHDIEKLIDWYYNSGHFVLTLRYLLGLRPPFELFDDLAVRMRAAGLLGSAQSVKTRAGALWEYAALFAEKMCLDALIAHDLLRSGRGAELPDAIHKALAAREFLRSARDGHPADRRLQTPATPHAPRVYAAMRYKVDVLSFEKGGTLEPRDCVIAYDSRGRVVYCAYETASTQR